MKLITMLVLVKK